MSAPDSLVQISEPLVRAGVEALREEMYGTLTKSW